MPDETPQFDVNPGYAEDQLARALRTSVENADASARERALSKIAKWTAVMRNILTGSVNYGSRTPVDGVPPWATLEVVTGGFATGALLAGGPLQEHEKALLQSVPAALGKERLALNAHYLSDAGIAQLQEMLETGRYDVGVPEEGALLVVAWLVKNGRAEEARALLDQISSQLGQLRFYPIPTERPRAQGTTVRLQNAGKTLGDLRRIMPSGRIAAQKESVEIWAPMHDRVAALFFETVAGEWPCQRYPEGWTDRAKSLLAEYGRLRASFSLCKGPERKGGHQGQLRRLLAACAEDSRKLTGREVGRIRRILRLYTENLGGPASLERTAARRRRAADVAAPSHHAIAAIVAARLGCIPAAEGIDDPSRARAAVSLEEASRTGVPEGAPVPPSVGRKAERCLNESWGALIEMGHITSGDTLAKVLPQMTSGIKAEGFADPSLRRLYGAIYRAFRRRRSLLLVNLESQVRLGELPWVAAIERFRRDDLPEREVATRALEEIGVASLTFFPQAIIPNKLLSELRALAKSARLDIPLTDELAADIFMGRFSGKFVDAAKDAARLMRGTLYATYYGIDFEAILKLSSDRQAPLFGFLGSSKNDGAADFAGLCAARAGQPLDDGEPAANGMIIEQQQILTTQNLAALFSALDLRRPLEGRLAESARSCFRWVCARQQVRADKFHARLIALKNGAYAWRQMIFYLSFLPEAEVAEFLIWADAHLRKQRAPFPELFAPALQGLRMAAKGESLDGDAAKLEGARRFTGWSKSRHWLLGPDERRQSPR